MAFYFKALKYNFIIFAGMEQWSIFHTYIFPIYKEDDLNKNWNIYEGR